MSRAETTGGAGSARVLRIALAAAVLVAAVPVVVFAVPQVVGADRSLAVLSGSMRPAVAPGDAVVVERVPSESIETGDIITYRTGRTADGEPQYVTHRVVRVIDRQDGLAFRTKGDANESPDPRPVPAGDLLGRVVLVLPLVGHVVAFAGSTVGRVVLVGGPAALFLLNEALRTLRASRSAERTEPGASPGGATVEAPKRTGADPSGRATVGAPRRTKRERPTRRVGRVGPPSGNLQRGEPDGGTYHGPGIRARALDAGDGLTILRVVDADPGAERELRDGRRLSTAVRDVSSPDRR